VMRLGSFTGRRWNQGPSGGSVTPPEGDRIRPKEFIREIRYAD
jgi:hypothetical protein